jgi:glycosyltransferase involved in cell wall biosynthesis
MSSQPLLTIAIPTWNRAESLRVALQLLLPQMRRTGDRVQLVLSDNASDDATPEIAAEFKKAFPDVNFISNRNATNLGFMGNLRACRALSTGRYFWLLSDDDYVIDGALEYIVRCLAEKQPVAVFLADWGKERHGDFGCVETDLNGLLNRACHHLTLISAVIFPNQRENDERLFREYGRNAFFGFAMFLSSLQDSGVYLILTGNTIDVSNAKPKGYNWYYVFTHDLEILGRTHPLLLKSPALRSRLYNNVLRRLIFRCYVSFKITGDVNSELKALFDPIPLSEAERLIWTHYRGYRNYWFYLFPARILPAWFLRSLRRVWQSNHSR